MTARLIVAAAAAVVTGFVAGGGTFNPYAAAQGFAFAYGVTGFLDPNAQQRGPRLEDLKAPQASPGAPLPFVQGAIRTSGFNAWCSAKRELATTTEQGGKGAPGVDVTTYRYEADVLYVLAANEIAGVRRIWRNGQLIWSQADDADEATLQASAATDAWRAIRVYTGAADQLPDPAYEAAVGVANAPAYRGRGSVFIEGLQLLQGGQLPLLEFEVVTRATAGAVDALVRLQWTGRDGTLADESSYAVPYAVGGTAPTVTESGLIRIACPQNGTGWVSWADAGLLKPAGAPLTVQARAVPTAVTWGASYQNLIFAIEGGSSWYFRCSLREGGAGQGDNAYNVWWETPGSSGSVAISGAGAHVAFEYSGGATGTAWFYVNGEPVASYAIADFGMGASAALRVGAYGIPSYNGPVDYTIDNLRYELRSVWGGVAFDPPVSLPPVDAPATTLAAEGEALADVVRRICERAGLAAADIDTTALAGIEVRGFAVPGGTSARAALETLRAAYFFDARESDRIYFVPRGGAPAAALAWDELGAADDPHAAVDPLPMLRGSDDELPARWVVRYANAAADYQPGSETGDRIVTRSTAVQAIDLALSLLPTEAKRIANVAAIDAQVALLRSEAALTMQRAALEPADVVTAADADGLVWRWQIARIEDSAGIRKLALRLDDAQALAQGGITDASYQASGVVLPLGDMLIAPLDIPILRDADNDAGYYVAARGSVANWRGGAVMESVDDVSFERAASITEQGIIGTATTALGAWAGGAVFDEGNSVVVDVGPATLASYSRDAIVQGTAPGYLIGDEILHARTAALQAPGIYRLSGLLRGRRGTEWATGAHQAGERVVVLQPAGLRRVRRAAGQLGVPYFLRGVTFGRSLGTAESEGFTDTGEGLRPFAPVGIRAARDAAGNVTLAWTRRTRLAARLLGSAGISAPLGEAAEAYEVIVYADGSYTGIRRLIQTAAPAATYSAADQAADFGAPQATLYIGVRQMGAVPGREAREAA